MGAKKAGMPKSRDISASRLSHGDPIGFPPHPREWFSIIVYHYLIYTVFRFVQPAGINVCYNRFMMSHLLWPVVNTKKPGHRIVCAIFRRPGCLIETLGFSVLSSRIV